MLPSAFLKQQAMQESSNFWTDTEMYAFSYVGKAPLIWRPEWQAIKENPCIVSLKRRMHWWLVLGRKLQAEKKIITLMLTKEERKANLSSNSRKAKLASSNRQHSKVIIDHLAVDLLTRVGSDGFLYVAYKRKRNFALWCVSKHVSEMLSYFSLLSLIEKQRSAKLNGLIIFAIRRSVFISSDFRIWHGIFHLHTSL